MKIINVDHFQMLHDVNEKFCALGQFETLHIAHQKIITEMVNDAKVNNCQSAVITFDKPFNKSKVSIFKNNERFQMFDQLGVDILYVIKVSSAITQETDSSFINWLKKEKINKIFCGQDYRFGKNASGNVSMLKLNFQMKVFDDLVLNDMKISTTKIREYIKQGQIPKANEMLGYNYFLKGKVVKAKQLGRTINFPTANIVSDVIIATGVYETRTIYNQKEYISLTNVGYNPTVQNSKVIKVETHLLDFDEEIYGEEIRVEFIKKIRDERKFSSLDELKKQIKKDIESIK